jgi:hypothetical protein
MVELTVHPLSSTIWLEFELSNTYMNNYLCGKQ